MLKTFIYKSDINCSAQKLFEWHMQENAFEQLCPSWEKVKIIKRVGNFPNTFLPQEVHVAVSPAPFIQIPWHLKHIDFIHGQEFTDVQVTGPFKSYKHRHLMLALDDKKSQLIDQIDCELPLDFVTGFLGYAFLQNKFDKLFEFRHAVTQKAFVG
jgi:ligand-binding SRPBCC domain-containing protein